MKVMNTKRKKLNPQNLPPKCMKFSSVSVHVFMVVRKAFVGLMNVYTVCACVTAVWISRVTDEVCNFVALIQD